MVLRHSNADGRFREAQDTIIALLPEAIDTVYRACDLNMAIVHPCSRWQIASIEYLQEVIAAKHNSVVFTELKEFTKVQCDWENRWWKYSIVFTREYCWISWADSLHYFRAKLHCNQPIVKIVNFGDYCRKIYFLLLSLTSLEFDASQNLFSCTCTVAWRDWEASEGTSLWFSVPCDQVKYLANCVLAAYLCQIIWRDYLQEHWRKWQILWFLSWHSNWMSPTFYHSSICFHTNFML